MCFVLPSKYEYTTRRRTDYTGKREKVKQIGKLQNIISHWNCSTIPAPKCTEAKGSKGDEKEK